MKLSILLSAITFVAARIVGKDAPDTSVETKSDTVVTITNADIVHAKSLSSQSLLIDKPNLVSPASIELDSSTFDGDTQTETIVKDIDGRLFLLDSTASSSFSDQRYFLILDPIGISWALKNLPRVSSTRSDQIIGYYAAGHSSVSLLGSEAPGETIVYFNYELFVVTATGTPGSGTDGFSASCAIAGNGASCASEWQRLDNAFDPFDAK